jgi:hypothetical protein
MTNLARNGKVGGLVALIGAVCVWFGPGRGAESKAPAAAVGAKEQDEDKPAPKDDKIGFYYGTASCYKEACHGGPSKKKLPITPLITNDEYKIWQEKDKHGDAYQSLLPQNSQLAEQMQKLLRGEKLIQRKDCLACHSVVISEQAVRAGAKKAVSFDLKEGVSCVACHGIAAKWYREHSLEGAEQAWRKLSRSQKDHDYGLTNVWGPLKRAELCASCHIGKVDGDPAQRKFVTHEMYAAGHPPLPPFEVATFSKAMPVHWTPRAHKFKAKYTDADYYAGEQETIRELLVGAAVSLRVSMELLVAKAKECEKAKEGSDKRVLDFANFDCYSCHHELRPNSERQRRGFAGKPGRVPMRPWPTTLVPLAIAYAYGPKEVEAETAKYRRLEKAVNDAFSARPFGDNKKVAISAEALKTWAQNLATRLNQQQYGRPRSREALVKLLELHKDQPPKDFDSARLLGWSFQTMHGELYKKSTSTVDKSLRGLDEQVLLKIVPRKGEWGLHELDRSMKARRDFKADSFRSTILGLYKDLSKTPPGPR